MAGQPSRNHLDNVISSLRIYQESVQADADARIAALDTTISHLRLENTRLREELEAMRCSHNTVRATAEHNEATLARLISEYEGVEFRAKVLDGEKEAWIEERARLIGRIREQDAKLDAIWRVVEERGSVTG